jgi:hypothetical protein
MPSLTRNSIAAPTTTSAFLQASLIENASEQFVAPSAPCPEAFPIKANDFSDKCLESRISR